MTPDDLAEACVPLAARLVGAVHDDGPFEVAEILTAVPEGTQGLHALAVVLAAMVDPEKSTRDLLGWVEGWHAQVALFHNDVGDTAPRAWSDHQCHALWMSYRRVDSGRTPREWAGYREWERRRAIRRRGAAWEHQRIHAGVGTVVSLRGGVSEPPRGGPNADTE